jgi:hypothetical protein
MNWGWDRYLANMTVLHKMYDTGNLLKTEGNNHAYCLCKFIERLDGTRMLGTENMDKPPSRSFSVGKDGRTDS